MTVLRWGIAGSGNICHDFLNALNCGDNSDRHKVVAVAARTEETARKLADNFKIAKAYGGYNKLAKDEEVDIVYVGTIHSTHKDITKLMLESGKHVLCEKPLALNPTETAEMIDAAERNGVFFMEGMWMLFQPANVEMRRRMREEQAIGKPVQVIVNFGRDIDWPRFRAAEFGGGTLLEFGVYGVYLTQAVFAKSDSDRPVSVTCVGQLNDQGTDDGVTIVLKYACGGSATLVYQSKVDTSCTAEIFGTKGSFKLGAPGYMCTCSVEGPTKGEVKTFPLPSAAPFEFNYWNSAMLLHEADHVRDCIIKGLKQSPVVSHKSMRAVSEILEAAKKDIGIKYPQDV